jgi:NAD(P)H dehydrogenase (quinone)
MQLDVIMILVTGATGQLGQSVIKQLVKRVPATAFSALARSEQKARTLLDAGIDVRMGDYDHPMTLERAFEGVKTLLFISSMSPDRAGQQKRVVDIATHAGVHHIVYTGLAIRDIRTSAVANVMASHFETEKHIQDAGMAFTFLRNTMYAEAIPTIIGPAALEQGIALNAGTGSVPYALRRELGEAAANVLTQPGHEGRTYQLTGTHALGYGEIAQQLSALAARKLDYADIPAEKLRSQLTTAGLPPFMVELTIGTLEDIKHHQYEVASTDLANLLGRAPAAPTEMLSEVFAPWFTH